MNNDLMSPPEGLNSEVLDHAKDFVHRVGRDAPSEYQQLVDAGHFSDLLHEGRFNHGKLFTYACFRVFRKEFQSRFPQASQAACINAFSGLFLKNDISITNLLMLIEGSGEIEQLEKYR